MNLIWWILGLGAAGGVVYLISSSTGKPVAASAACISDLPEPFKSSARAAIASRDATRISPYVAQATASGWACAAQQLRDAVAVLTAAGLVASTTETKKEEKPVEENKPAETDKSKMDLVAASVATATTLGESALHGKILSALALFAAPTSGAPIVDYKSVAFVAPPTVETAKSLDDLSSALSSRGYFFASAQATDAADAARKAIASGPATFAAEPSSAATIDTFSSPSSSSDADKAATEWKDLPEPLNSTMTSRLAASKGWDDDFAIAKELCKLGYKTAAEQAVIKDVDHSAEWTAWKAKECA